MTPQVGTLLAHRAKEAGVERVRMPVRRGGRGGVMWFRSVLRSHGALPQTRITHH